MHPFPNEIVCQILSFVPSRDLARLAVVCSTFHLVVEQIYKQRIRRWFLEGNYHYIFEASQPAEVRDGFCLLLSDQEAADLISCPLWRTCFTFPSKKKDVTYSFTLDQDSFIQLCVIGNVVKSADRIGLAAIIPNLNRIAPLFQSLAHMVEYPRIKREVMQDIKVGDTFMLRLSDHIDLRTVVRNKTIVDRAHASHVFVSRDDLPVLYKLEVPWIYATCRD